MWARRRCRISPSGFLAECCKRQLNQGSFVLLYFRLFTFSDLYWVCVSVFSCTVLFVSISQVIGCEDRLRNDLYCVNWVVKLYSNQAAQLLDTRHPREGPCIRRKSTSRTGRCEHIPGTPCMMDSSRLGVRWLSSRTRRSQSSGT